MNTKPLLYLSCSLAVILASSTVNAREHRRGGKHSASKLTRNGGVMRSFSGGNRFAGKGQRWSGQRFASNRNWTGQHSSGGNWKGKHWNGSNWSGQNWSGSNNNWNWHHHHRHHRRSSVVFLDFGFPFWGWGGYPSSYYYDYYPSAYGCYPSGYYGSRYYGSGFYGSYNYNYGNGYGYNDGYGNGYSSGYDAKVAELQRRLANAGYYRGEIDGIWGSRTQYALKAYRHDHPNGNDNNNYGGSSPTLRDRPYSPPPVTTEPAPTE